MKIYEFEKMNDWGQNEKHCVNLERVEEVVLKVIDPEGEHPGYTEYSVKLEFNNGGITIHKKTPEEAIKLYKDIKKCMEE